MGEGSDVMRFGLLLAGAAMLTGVLSCSRGEDSPGRVGLPAAADDEPPADAVAGGHPRTTDRPAPGVSATRVLFGQSAGFSGSAARIWP